MKIKSLGQKQKQFTLAISHLIEYTYQKGYSLTFGDAYRDPRVFGVWGGFNGYGHKKSNHKKRLAVDFNLFVSGKYITSGKHKAWKVLHDYWELLGGSEIILDDPNHFSFEYGGVK